MAVDKHKGVASLEEYLRGFDIVLPVLQKPCSFPHYVRSNADPFLPTDAITRAMYEVRTTIPLCSTPQST